MITGRGLKSRTAEPRLRAAVVMYLKKLEIPYYLSHKGGAVVINYNLCHRTRIRYNLNNYNLAKMVANFFVFRHDDNER